MYGTLQHADKSGTGLNINGIPTGVKPETTNGIELGLKTFLLDDTLTFNIDIYRLNIHDYQQAIRVVDQFTTDLNISNNQANPLAYTSAQGNVNKVVAQGIDFDSTYNGIDNFTFRLSGAYNDAHYADFKNSPKADEQGYLTVPFVDRTGETLPGAPKYTLNLGVEYRKPFNTTELHSSFNTSYISSYNNGDTFSEYTVIGGYAITDASIGLGTLSKKFDVTFIVKNIFDRAPHEEAWTSYEPYTNRRWIGLEFSSHF